MSESFWLGVTAGVVATLTFGAYCLFSRWYLKDNAEGEDVW